MIRKALSLTTILTAYIVTAVAHETESHLMMAEGWHGTMWSTGHWAGSLFMIALLVLAILAIIYLFQKIQQNTQQGENQ